VLFIAKSLSRREEKSYRRFPSAGGLPLYMKTRVAFWSAATRRGASLAADESAILAADGSAILAADESAAEKAGASSRTPKLGSSRPHELFVGRGTWKQPPEHQSGRAASQDAEKLAYGRQGASKFRHSSHLLPFHQHRDKTLATHLFSSTSCQALKPTFFLHVFSTTSSHYLEFFHPFYFARIADA
jgi:hypothetical protein